MEAILDKQETVNDYAAFKAAEESRIKGATTSEPDTEAPKDAPAKTENEPDSDPAKETKVQEDKPKKDRSFDGRIAELTAHRKAAEDRAAKLEEELRELRTRKPDTQEKTEPAKPKAEGEPNPEDYKTYAEYMDAKLEYKLEQREKAAAARKAEEDAKVKKESAEKEFQARLRADGADIEGFEALTKAAASDFADVPSNSGVNGALERSKNPAKLLHYLITHPDEFREIAALDPQEAYDRMQEIQFTIRQKAKPELVKTKPVSKAAPPPQTTLNGVTPPGIEELPGNADYNQFKKWEKSRLKSQE